MKIKLLIIFLLAGFLSSVCVTNSYALTSPHPIQYYEKGEGILNSYHGNPAKLYQAKSVFRQLIDRFPDSPLGYLGMSRAYTIDAYRYGKVYDMEKIRDLALPYAMRALELGPSIRSVHANYTVFEKIFEHYELNQKLAQDYLTLLPDSPETYYVVATFIRDQNEIDKALEYYNAALELEPSEGLRLKILKRIALIYLEELNQPEKAVEYYTQALDIWKDSPILNEYIGLAFIKTQNYKQAIERLTKSLNLVSTSIPQHHLMQAKGYQFEQEGKIQEAIEYFEKSSKYGELNSAMHYKLGNLYYEVANYKNAYDHFKRVIDLSPAETGAYYFAGRSATSLGNDELARDYFREYLKRNTEGQEVEWIRSNIPEFSFKQE